VSGGHTTVIIGSSWTFGQVVWHASVGASMDDLMGQHLRHHLRMVSFVVVAAAASSDSAAPRASIEAWASAAMVSCGRPESTGGRCSVTWWGAFAVMAEWSRGCGYVDAAAGLWACAAADRLPLYETFSSTI